MLSTNHCGFYVFVLSSSSYSCYFSSLSSLIFFSSPSPNANTICHAVETPVKQHGHLRFAAFGPEREREHVEERCSLHAARHNKALGHRLHLQQGASYVTWEENVMRRCWRCGLGERLRRRKVSELKWRGVDGSNVSPNGRKTV